MIMTGSRTRGDLGEPGFVIIVIGTHQSIPEIEI